MHALDSQETLDMLAAEAAQAKKSQSMKLTLEKLEGGFISDVSGKRKIYPDAGDVLEALDMYKTINKLEHAEYQVHIDIMHKDEYQDRIDLLNIKKEEELEGMSLEEAKKAGIIAEHKFNPIKNAPVEPDITGEIKITIKNAYSVSRLKSLPWKDWDDQLPMSVPEKAAIAGLNSTSFYSLWNNMKNGKAMYQRPDSRVGCTILAMYYERTLGVRTSAKEQCEKMREDVLNTIRELELIGNGKSHIKVSDMVIKLGKLRTALLG